MMPKGFSPVLPFQLPQWLSWLPPQPGCEDCHHDAFEAEDDDEADVLSMMMAVMAMLKVIFHHLLNFDTGKLRLACFGWVLLISYTKVLLLFIVFLIFYAVKTVSSIYSKPLLGLDLAATRNIKVCHDNAYIIIYIWALVMMIMMMTST